VITKRQLQKNMSLRLPQKIVAKNTGKKSAGAKKPVQKKAPCYETIRLQLGWSLLDVVATW
jgi:hypothetical protein